MAALLIVERGDSTLKLNEGKDDDAILSTLSCAAEKFDDDERFVDDLEDWVMDAKVVFSISASGSEGLEGASLKTGVSAGFGGCTGAGG